jgi:dTDP-4-dehydrorhamnose reductase
MKKILLTGANGLLGQKIIQKLIDRAGIELYATGRGENINAVSSGYTYLDLDLTDFPKLEIAVRKIKPDIIIHGAAMTNVDACELDPAACNVVNVEVTQRLSALCEEWNGFLIFVSTDFIFDGTAGPYTETDTPNPLSHYGHSKWNAEKSVQAAAHPWAIVRTVLLYGYVEGLSRTNIVLWVKKSLEQGLKIRVVNDQVRTPTLAEDLADGIISIAMREKTGIFHISGAEQMRIIDIAKQVAAFWKLDASLIEETTSDVIAQPAKRPPVTGFIILRAQTELGYKPHNFKAGLELLDRQLKA